MRSLYSCYEEIETELLNGDPKNPDLMKLAIQLQRNDILADIEEVLQILSIKKNDVNDSMSSIVDKLDNIAFNLSNISKDIVL